MYRSTFFAVRFKVVKAFVRNIHNIHSYFCPSNFERKGKNYNLRVKLSIWGSFKPIIKETVTQYEVHNVNDLIGSMSQMSDI